jgi:hypothetical protein
MKLIAGLESAGIELIAEGAASQGSGRGVRLKVAPGSEGLPRHGDGQLPPRAA